MGQIEGDDQGAIAVLRCGERRRRRHGGFAQTPPDLVVKFQPIDIVDVILQLIVRPRVAYQREIKGWAALNI